MTPPRLITIIFSPGLMPVLSRTATGMTTWNLGETVTTLDFMSIILSLNQLKIDSDTKGHGLKKIFDHGHFRDESFDFLKPAVVAKKSSLKLIR